MSCGSDCDPGSLRSSNHGDTYLQRRRTDIIWNTSGDGCGRTAVSGRGCDRCKLFYRSDGDGTSGGKDGRICYDSAHRKAKRRTPGTRGKENGVPHDTGRICRGRCGTGKSGSSHCRWMLRYNGKAYQGTFGCNAGDGTSQATCIASQDSCV